MKKQSGFTLIELLLVLAIIGIISAIALPALLGQRARARDKSAVQGTIGRIADLVGQYDKAKDLIANGSTSTEKDIIDAYLSSSIGTKDKNPWATAATDLIMATTVTTVSGYANKTLFDVALADAGATQQMGKGQGYMQLPTTANPGFVGVAVKLNEKNGASNMVQIKSVAVE